MTPFMELREAGVKGGTKRAMWSLLRFDRREDGQGAERLPLLGGQP